ncbi:MAG: hypothetical protein L6420_12270 [Elusimicrobia bacterium]|nr:hypothetical protein [Elusimicrobiota bacterium]
MKTGLEKIVKLSQISLIMVLVCSGVLYAEKKENKDIIVPDTVLIDMPTAGILDYYGFLIKTRFFNDGGIVGNLNFGVMERLNLGASMNIEKFIGSDSDVKMVRPEIQVKFRFFDGGYYTPALALGYDGQGYFYDKNQKKYMEKGRGLFVVGSKEFGMPNLVFHGGLNVSDFDDNYVFGFLAMNYTLEDQVSFILEYDNFFHSGDPSRTNIGTRFYITPYFQLDLALREFGKNIVFSNGAKRKSERIVQMSYTTSF